MVQFFESIPDDLRDWALQQSVFFTASAPLYGKHVNLSPKGLPSTTFTIFDPNHAAYIDATGSGSETIAHVYENGRITIMFCSFTTSPRIMRFFCKGRVVEWDQPEFEPLLKKMGKQNIDGARAVILLDIFKVQTSCGYAVPMLAKSPATADESDAEKGAAYFEDRKTLGHFAKQKVAKGVMHDYQKEWNANSLDGLPSLKRARRDRGNILWLDNAKVRARRLVAETDALLVGLLLGVFFVLAVQRLEASVPKIKLGV